jgi:polar amino acid transport system permease protein
MFQTVPGPIGDLLTVLDYWNHILAGFIVTMWLFGFAILFGFVFGLVLSIARQYGGAITSRISTGYIELIRGTPLLVQLLFFYFLPFNLPFFQTGGWSFIIEFILFNKEVRFILLDYRTLVGLLTLGLNSAAYQAEYLRGAMASVGSGQLLAAQSVGMSRREGIIHIVLPQALRRVIPAWSNEAAYLPKYTVIVYYIGVVELLAKAHYIVTQTFLTLWTYIIAAIIFLIVVSLISQLLDYVHKRTKIPGL